MPRERDRKNPVEAARGESARRERIAVAAYYNAERRAFQEGGEMDDWLEAERQIDGLGTEKGPKGEVSARQSAGSPGGADAPSAAATERPDFPDLNQAGIEHIEPDEVQKWARQLNVPAPKLREAIKRVGPVVSDVKRFLDGASAPS